MILLKRVYDPVSQSDGKRILVDRLWPRGLEKEKAVIDEWMKDIAPSDELLFTDWTDNRLLRHMCGEGSYRRL